MSNPRRGNLRLRSPRRKTFSRCSARRRLRLLETILLEIDQASCARTQLLGWATTGARSFRILPMPVCGRSSANASALRCVNTSRMHRRATSGYHVRSTSTRYARRPCVDQRYRLNPGADESKVSAGRTWRQKPQENHSERQPRCVRANVAHTKTTASTNK
jgi:hypothetical protein